MGAETVLTALGALSASSGEADARTPEQRRADALVGLARRTLDRGDTPIVGGERPHVTVVVSAETLTAAPNAAGINPVDAAPDATGARPVDAAPDAGADPVNAAGDAAGTEPATLGYGGSVSGETARLLACDASVSRVIMAGPSVVLDAGRTSRLVTASQRRARWPPATVVAAAAALPRHGVRRITWCIGPTAAPPT